MSADLSAHVGIDTNCFVYLPDGRGGPRAEWLEANVFEPLVANRRRAVTSTLSVSELLVPARNAVAGRNGTTRNG